MKLKEEYWERLFKGYERSGLSQNRSAMSGRSRDTSHLMPPAQIRTCGITAYGSY